MKLICKIFGHNYASGTLLSIKHGPIKQGMICKRCGKYGSYLSYRYPTTKREKVSE